MSSVYFLVDEQMDYNYAVEFISMDLEEVRKEKARLIEIYKERRQRCDEYWEALLALRRSNKNVNITELREQFGFAEGDSALYVFSSFNIYVAQLNVAHSWELIE